MINKEEVRHIAKLARLGLTEKEMEKMREELSAILDYAEKLKKLNAEGIEPTSHSVAVENVFREDKEKPELVEKEKLLEMAPERKESFVKVKPVF